MLMLKSEFVDVTPEVAEKLLAGNSDNRPLRPSHVRRLADAMKRGQWKTTHQGILLDRDGNVADGQHRLHAIVESKISAVMRVEHFDGKLQDVFDVLDRGRPRGSADDLALVGVHDAKAVSSVVRCLLVYQLGWSQGRHEGGVHVSNIDIVKCYRENPGVEKSVLWAKAVPAPLRPMSIFGCAHYLFGQIDAQARDEFMMGLSTGAGLDEGDPRLSLRAALLRQAESTRRGANRVQLMAWVIKSWNKWRDQEPLTLLRHAKHERFPAPK
jgi:hypothetical protein